MIIGVTHIGEKGLLDFFNSRKRTGKIRELDVNINVVLVFFQLYGAP